MRYFKIISVLLAALLGCSMGHAQELSLSTNVLGYAELGPMNMEASWGFDRHWSANLGLRYNPFTFPGREGIADRMQARQRTLALGGRYWPWHIHSGWWLAGKAQYQEYNKEICKCQEGKITHKYQVCNKEICKYQYNKIINKYFNSKEKNIKQLEEYAKIFNVYEKITTIMEVLMK